MGQQKFRLKEQPLFEFNFVEKGFQLTDESNFNTTAFFEYKMISQVETKKESNYWLFNVIQFIAGFFIGDYGWNNLKRERQVRFAYQDKTIVIFTQESDWKLVHDVAALLERKISKHN